MADVNKIPKWWPESSLTFKDVVLVPHDLPAPAGSAGPVGPQGPIGVVGPKGPPGVMGEPGKSPLQMAHEELALAQMKELGSVFKIPAHPDPEVQKKMVAEALEAQYVGTPKSKPNHFEKLWKASTTKRSSSAEPNMSNTAKPTNPSEQILNALPTKWPAEAQKILDEEAKRKGQHVTLAELDTVHLLAPQEYDAQLVFEVVRQVIQEKIEDSSTHTLKKVSDTIAEVIVEERKAWKQAYNAVTSDYHRFKVEAGNWSKRFAVEMAELSAQVNDLNNQMVVAKAEVKRLETENSKLRIKGTLGKSPRKVKVS